MNLRLKVAGHEFMDNSVDSCCILAKSGGAACTMTRAVLFTAVPEDVGKDGICHYSSLTQTEYSEITSARDEYEKHCEHVMSALRQVCG